MSARRFVAFAALSAILFSAAPAGASQSGTSWPELLGDSGHSSYSTDPAITSANASTFGVKWMANLYSTDLGSPVVAYNSTLGKTVVYVGNQRADLYAIDAATGQELWSTNLGVDDKMEDSPMVAPDGSVWIGTSDNATLYKVNGATGTVECSVKASLPIDASPMLATPNGGVQTVFWTYIDSSTIAGPTFATRESDCSQIWSFSNYLQEAGSWTSPALGQTAGGESLTLVGTADPDSTEYALDANTGALVWDYSPLNPPPGVFDIGDAATTSSPGNNGLSDGAAYFDTKYGYEYALDMTTGAPLWQFHIAPGTKASSSRSSAALDGTNLVFGYGQASGFGGSGGVYALNAVTGAQLWQYTDPDEVLSSPAIVGSAGSEVVAFGSISGAFHVLGLASGNQLYSYQTGGYITSSPAEAQGEVFLSSSDGFLYAYGPGGGNGPAPSSTITSPADQSQIPNPNGNLTITGTASDPSGVTAVEVAVQQNGTSGPWYNATSGNYNSAPIRNGATLSNPGATSTTWSLTLPVPASGGTYSAFASAVNGNHIVNHSALSSFVILPSKGEPNIRFSAAFVPPGSSFRAGSTGFKPLEQVTFTLFGTVVATATATKTGYVPNTNVKVPVTATFGQTSLTLNGLTSGKSTSGTVTITNNWTQGGHDPSRSASEPHDPVIEQAVSVGNGSVLSQSWYYQANAPVNSSPTVVDAVAYFGNDSGVLTALVNNTGAPKWTYTTPSGAAIHTAPAVDPAGNVIVASSDGTLYTINGSGLLAASVSLGGNLTSPAIDNGQIYLTSDNGHIYDVADSTDAIQWTSSLSGAGHSSPAYDSAANLVIAGDDSGAVTAFNATTGAQVWQATTGGGVVAPPMIYKGTVYIGSKDGNFYAINETTGAVKWKYTVTGPIVANAALYGNNQIAIGDSNGIAYYFSSSGSLAYKADSRSKSPIVGISTVQGNTFVEMANGLIGMIRIGGPVPFGWSQQTNSTLATSPAIVDGTVYVGAADGGLYAFTPQGANPLSRTKNPSISITDSNSWMCTTP